MSKFFISIMLLLLPIGAFSQTIDDGYDELIANMIAAIIHQDSIDEISESPIGRAFTVHKVFIADIDFAIVFQLSERDASFIHKPEQNRFQHIDGIISDSSQLMSREFAQIFA